MTAVETELPKRSMVNVARADDSAAGIESLRPILSVKRLNAWFGKARVIRNVSADFSDRSVTAVIGPSGCGKSRCSDVSTGCTRLVRAPSSKAM